MLPHIENAFQKVFLDWIYYIFWNCTFLIYTVYSKQNVWEASYISNIENMFQERTEPVSLYIQIENALQRVFLDWITHYIHILKLYISYLHIVFETMIMGCKVDSVKEACAKCFAVHILKFEIFQTTWKAKQKNSKC